MTRPPLSPAGAAVLRGLVARAGVARDQVRLVHFRSTDWQSLTFVGERHEIALRLPGPDSAAALERLTAGLEQAEWSVPGQTVADIAVRGTPRHEGDGAITLHLEALTIAD